MVVPSSMTHEYVICPFSIAFMIMEIEKTVNGFNNCNVVAPTWYVHIIIRVKGTMQLHSTSIYGPDHLISTINMIHKEQCRRIEKRFKQTRLYLFLFLP